jgi:hypothetical protein
MTAFQRFENSPLCVDDFSEKFLSPLKTKTGGGQEFGLLRMMGHFRITDRGGWLMGWISNLEGRLDLRKAIMNNELKKENGKENCE